MPASSQPRYGYRLPPEAHVGGWLVRSERVSVGDRLNLHINESDGDEVIMPGSPATFEVVAIELTGDEGQQVGRQHIGAPTAVWAGTLVLRLVEDQP
jgi:hypothetical protein